MKRPLLIAEQFDRYVYFDGVEIAHCSDGVAAELIVHGLNCLRLTEGRIAHILSNNADQRRILAGSKEI